MLIDGGGEGQTIVSLDARSFGLGREARVTEFVLKVDAREGGPDKSGSLSFAGVLGREDVLSRPLDAEGEVPVLNGTESMELLGAGWEVGGGPGVAVREGMIEPIDAVDARLRLGVGVR